MPSRPALAIARAMRAVAAVPILLAVATPAAAEDPDLAARVDTYVAPFVDAGHLSGSLMVARGDDVLLERSWGWADAEHRVPNGPDTPTGIASVTKPMTIALVCRLAEEGLLAPEDTISRWIPDFPRGNDITVSHLLNHRACIPHRVTTPQEETIPRTAADMVELVKQAGLLPLEPGEKSVYSSAGFSVLARVVELASGRSYDDALQHYLCEPAGMERTGHHDSRDLVPGRARGYVLDEGGLANGPLVDLSFLVGAGSVLSTPRDLHRMLRALVDGNLGDAAPVALMRGSGLSWNGVTIGFRSFVQYRNSDDTEAIFVGNLVSGATDALARDLADLIDGKDVATPARPNVAFAKPDPELMRRVEGTYRNDRDQAHDIRVDGDRLWFGQWLLLPTGPTTFFSPQDYANVEVVSGPDGAIERLDWARPDGTLPWRRVAGDVAADR